MQRQTYEPETREADAEVSRVAGRQAEREAALHAGETRERIRAARGVRSCGSAAVEALCAALRDKEAEVRIAAAQSLGHIGDERAVQPLASALRTCFVGHSARWQLVTGAL